MSQMSNDFEKYGGSYLLSEDNYYRYVSGYSEIGRPDGQFIAPSNQMDALLDNHPNNPREWERQLGLYNGSLGDNNIHRVDVYNPQEYEPRLPTSELSGANDNFIEGGKTPGGQDECVINQFPNPETNPETGKISNINIDINNAQSNCIRDNNIQRQEGDHSIHNEVSNSSPPSAKSKELSEISENADEISQKLAEKTSSADIVQNKTNTMTGGMV